MFVSPLLRDAGQVSGEGVSGVRAGLHRSPAGVFGQLCPALGSLRLLSEEAERNTRPSANTQHSVRRHLNSKTRGKHTRLGPFLLCELEKRYIFLYLTDACILVL